MNCFKIPKTYTCRKCMFKNNMKLSESKASKYRDCIRSSLKSLHTSVVDLVSITFSSFDEYIKQIIKMFNDSTQGIFRPKINCKNVQKSYVFD